MPLSIKSSSSYSSISSSSSSSSSLSSLSRSSRSSSISSTCSSYSSYSSYSGVSSLVSASSLLKQKIGKEKEKEKEEERQQPQTTLFAGLTFFFDKDTISSLSARHKITQLAKHHQASVSLILSKKTTHYVIDLPSSLLRSLETSPTITSHSLIYKLNTAIKLNIKIVTVDFIYASITGLQLALQHVIEYPHEIKLLAPEIPIFCSRDDIAVTTEPPPGESNAADIAVIEPIQVDTLPDDTSSFSAASEFSALVSADFFPTRLQSPVLSKFSPKQVEEKGTLCNLMSQIETVNEGCPDELTLSFEESRFYRFFMNHGVTSEMTLDIPTRAEDKMGSVWSWGSGFKGQLGNGDKENGMQPDYIIMGEGSVVTQVSCGDRHSAAVDQQGEVWCWGYGCEGSLGQGEFKNSSYPLLVDAFSSIKVCMVACGRAHTAVLTSIGTVWSWGSNKSMQLGYSIESYTKSATPLELFAIKDAVYVACGGNNTAVIDRTAKMFTLGCNAHGQRGVGKKKLKSPAPTAVSFPGKATVSYANVGHGFMGAIVDSGTLYMWGRNLDSQCGNGSAHDLYTPQQVNVGTEVIQFSCGDTHTACVTSNGDIFTWGWGPAGQLGHTGDMAICTEPTQVEIVTNASMVCCGARHTVALTDQGKIWSWGANDSGQTGLPIFDYYFSDDEEESDEEEEEDDEESAQTSDLDAEWISPHVVDTMSKVAMIACGRDHALALVQGDYVPIQFTKDDNEDALFNWIETNSKLRNMDDDAFKEYLQNIRDDEYGANFSLLHLATYFGNEDVVNLLLSQNWIDVEILDARGDTPLHVSAERDLEGCCRILLDAGAKPDKKNNDGKTPIHIAVENRSMEVLSEIVEGSISNKSAIDNVGNTPLHYAVHLEHFEMAKYLIERAAQPQILDKSGKTALDYCSRSQASYFKSVAQKNDVFISYAHVDIVFAEKIKEYLESFAIKCWMDTARLEAGSDWRLDIGNGVLNSRLILFVGSRASVVSDWCIKELHMAKKHNLVIIPIWHQKVEFDSEVKSLIFGRSFLDFSETKYFEPNGKKLAKKLKGALTLLKQPKPNPYLQIPVLTTEQLWKQQFLSVLIEGHQQQQAACKLEDMLHSSAIFSVIHTLNLQPDSPFYKEREANINKCWGLVLLISDLGLARASIDKWWTYAEANNKKVYLCIIKGDASNIKTSDLPDQLRSENAPIFYLESAASIHQLIFFIHLSQREQFMASQVTVMEDKLDTSSTALRNNETEITALKKRFYVE